MKSKQLSNSPALWAQPLCLSLFTACTIGWLSPSAAKANLIVNGSFEAPALAADGIAPAAGLSPWLILGSVYRGGDSWRPAAQDGDQYIDLMAWFGVASQAFTVSAGGTYELAWYDSDAAFLINLGSPAMYQVSLQQIGQPIAFSGSFSVATPAGSDPAWTLHSFLMDLDPGDYSLTFTDDSGGTGRNFGAYLDNVSLVPKQPPGNGVPDIGATLPMMGLACGLLVGLRHFPRTRSVDPRRRRE